MVVFGAGASHDSDPDHPAAVVSGSPYRPPLTARLFAFGQLQYGARIGNYRQCLAIADTLRQLPDGQSIEQRLAMLQRDAAQYPHRHSQLAALKFYLREMLWETCERWNVQANFVTNYGTLLGLAERAR